MAKQELRLDDIKATIEQATKEQATKYQEELRKLSQSLVQSKEESPWVIGEKYFIRTVTMALTGECVWVGSQEIVLKNAAWIADTGRFSTALEKGVFDEVEPFPSEKVILGRSGVIDATIWGHDLPRNQK